MPNPWTEIGDPVDPCADLSDAPKPYQPVPGERWRVGTSEGTDGKTIYRHVPDGPERGELVGVMFSGERAAFVAAAVNYRIELMEEKRRWLTR